MRHLLENRFLGRKKATDIPVDGTHARIPVRTDFAIVNLDFCCVFFFFPHTQYNYCARHVPESSNGIKTHHAFLANEQLICIMRSCYLSTYRWNGNVFLYCAAPKDSSSDSCRQRRFRVTLGPLGGQRLVIYKDVICSLTPLMRCSVPTHFLEIYKIGVRPLVLRRGEMNLSIETDHFHSFLLLVIFLTFPHIQISRTMLVVHKQQGGSFDLAKKNKKKTLKVSK